MLEKTLNNPRTIAITGIMTAVIFVLTRFVQVPTPIGGYVHLGDAAVLFTGFAFGPVVGAIAGGLGTALSDLTSPYAQWAIFTLIVHGAMGFAAGYFVNGKSEVWRLALTSLICTVILVGGYFVAGLILMGMEATAEIGFNLSQAVAGIIVAVPLYYAVRRAYPPLITRRVNS